MQGNVGDLAAGHLNVTDVPFKRVSVSGTCLKQYSWSSLLVEEGLKNNDLITGLNKGHESTQHAWPPVSPLFLDRLTPLQGFSSHPRLRQ